MQKPWNSNIGSGVILVAETDDKNLFSYMKCDQNLTSNNKNLKHDKLKRWRWGSEIKQLIVYKLKSEKMIYKLLIFL